MRRTASCRRGRRARRPRATSCPRSGGRGSRGGGGEIRSRSCSARVILAVRRDQNPPPGRRPRSGRRRAKPEKRMGRSRSEPSQARRRRARRCRRSGVLLRRPDGLCPDDPDEEGVEYGVRDPAQDAKEGRAVPEEGLLEPDAPAARLGPDRVSRDVDAVEAREREQSDAEGFADEPEPGGAFVGEGDEPDRARPAGRRRGRRLERPPGLHV